MQPLPPAAGGDRCCRLPGISSSSSRPQPEIPLDETPPDVQVIVMEPDDAEIDAINAQPPKVERRMWKKSVDPVTAAAFKKIHDELRDEKELYQLHLKYYHMKLDAFKKRTSQLQLPKDIYDLYGQIVKGCETCSNLTDAPPRSKVSDSLRRQRLGLACHATALGLTLTGRQAWLCASQLLVSHQGCYTEELFGIPPQLRRARRPSGTLSYRVGQLQTEGRPSCLRLALRS